MSTLNLVTKFRISSLGDGKMYNSFSGIVVCFFFLTMPINMKYVQPNVHKKRRTRRCVLMQLFRIYQTRCFLASYGTASTFSPYELDLETPFQKLISARHPGSVGESYSLSDTLCPSRTTTNLTGFASVFPLVAT